MIILFPAVPVPCSHWEEQFLVHGAAGADGFGVVLLWVLSPVKLFRSITGLA